MDAENGAQSKRYRSRVVDNVITAIGMGMPIAWLAYSLFAVHPAYYLIQGLDYGQLNIAIMLVAALVIALFCTAYAAIMRRRALYFALVGLCCVLTVLAVAMPAVQPAKCMVGFAGAFLNMLIWAVWALQRRRVFQIVALSFGFAAVAILAIFFVPEDYRTVALLGIQIFSILIYVILVLPARSSQEFVHPRSDVWQIMFERWHMVLMRSVDVAIGVSIFIIGTWADLGHIRLVAFAFTLAVMATVLCFGVVPKHIAHEKSFLSLFVSIATVLLVCVCISDGLPQFFIAIVCIAVLVAFKTLSSLEVVGSRLVVGGYSELFYAGRLTAITLATISISYVACWVLAFVGDGYRYVEGVALCVMVTSTVFKLSSLVETEQVGLNTDEQRDIWSEAVDTLSVKCNLTERQKDIFHGLSRGRNARYLEDKFCLSSGTVKTHIRTVYEKLCVHSQQELINLVFEEYEKALNQNASEQS